ncbi:MAG: polysaccharide biosynthesis tyrosine autokinase [Planctomycetaceae bacterium]|jgi:capsular exopolysaccharide synthesis family protein|nr:polysaccharide biosynthesis tyrosine autokinase [Planctomycetaceae bacterium]
MIADNTNFTPESPVTTPGNIGANKYSGAAEFNLFDLLAILKRQWGLIIFGVLFAVLLGALYYCQTERLYKSDAQLFLMERNSSAAIDPNATSPFMALQDSLLSSHAMIIQSSKIIQDAFNLLKKEYEQVNNPKLQKLIEMEKEENPIEYIKKHLTTSKGGDGKQKNAMILIVSYTSNSAEESQAVLSAIVLTYLDFVQKEYADPTSKIVALHQESKNDFEKQLSALTATMNEFQEKHPDSYKVTGDSTITQLLLQKNMEDLQEINKKYDTAKAQLDSIERITGGAGAKASESDVFTAVLANLGENVSKNDSFLEFIKSLSQRSLFVSNSEIQRNLEEYRTQTASIYNLIVLKKLELNKLARGVIGADSQDNKQLTQDIADLEKMLKTIRQEGDAKIIKTELSSNADLLNILKKKTSDSLITYETQQKKISATIEELRRQLTMQGKVEMEISSYQSKRTILEDAVKQSINRLNDFSKLQTSLGLQVTDLEMPQEAKKPVWPSMFVILAVSLAGGVVLGSGLAYLVDMMDRTFHTPVEISTMIGAPVLAQLPKLYSIQQKHKWLRSTKRSGTLTSEVVAYHKPKSPESETFRGLRTSLLIGAKVQDHSVLQVTSTNPHDGKTTIAANLAVSIANSKRRVLLVDCDFRSPNMHSVFGIANGTGLSNYLHGEKNFDDILLTTPVENLTLITAGTNRTNPAEILSSPLFQNFLKESKEKFDMVVIDSPPTLAVSDTCIIASEVDHVLLTVRAVKNGRPSVLHAVYLLREVGANICGIAINTFRCHRFYSAYGEQEGYGSYGYGYGYGGYGYGGAYGYDDDEDRKTPVRKKTTAPVTQDRTSAVS